MKPPSRSFLLPGYAALLLVATPLRSLANWPTYLHDTTRVGATNEQLKLPLTKRWTYESPTPPKMAWGGENGRIFEGYEMTNRVRFDEVFNVAIDGGRVFFGSSVEGCMYAVDQGSGKLLWRFFTDAPIRLAPTVVGQNVMVGSDDGYVYCLHAPTGKLVWKLRAGPNEERVLARGRMISRWPIRTGVLVDDNVAYFGAGVFPHENVFLYAVEAATGKVIWKNDAISQSDAGRNDLSPQGYLLASKEFIFVPSGRGMASTFHRATGEIVDRSIGTWRGIGGTQALLADDQLYSVGEHQILATDQTTGKSGFGWFKGKQMTLSGKLGFMATGTQIIAVDRVAYAEGSRKWQKIDAEITKLAKDLKGHPAVSELTKLKAAEAAAKAASDGGDAAEIAKARKALEAAEKRYNSQRADYQSKKEKHTQMSAELAGYTESGVVWKFESKHASALILAGDLLLVGGAGEVLGLDVATGKQVWSAAVDGDARGLAVSDGHLLVSTSAGKVYDFNDAVHSSKEPAQDLRIEARDPFAKDDLSERYENAAEDILKNSGVTKGFCLVIGSGNGRLAYELAKRSDLTVYGVEQDAQKVKASREALMNTGMYGSRIHIDPLDLSLIPHANYFANLIVSDALIVTGEIPGLPANAAQKLKPVGGTVWLGVPANSPQAVIARARETIPAWLEATGLRAENALVESAEGWSRLVRTQLPGAGSWSHLYGNAGNTSSNSDERIKGGLSVLWYGDPGPGEMVNRHEGAVGPLSVNGRLFVQGENNVMAYDAYNGRFLWSLENPGALRKGVYNAREPGNMAASDDALFMVLDDQCLQINAETGVVQRRYSIPASPEEDRRWSYIAYDAGVIFGTATERKGFSADQQRRGKASPGATDRVFAFDVKSGKQLWVYQGKSVSHVSMAVGDGHLFLIDSSLTQEQRAELLKEDKAALKQLTGEAQKIAESRVKNADLRLAVCLDARSGAKVWENPVDVTDCSEIGTGGGSLSLIYSSGKLVLGGANANGHYWTQFLAGEFARRRLVVLDANTGRKMWAQDANYRHRPIVIDNEVIAEPWSYDIYTGAQKMRTHPLTGEQTPWMFARPGHHCGAISATPNMMFFRSKYTAYYNRDQDEGTGHFAGHRLGCWINTIPANGLVMIPEASAGCVCLFSIAATVVFEPKESRMQWGVYGSTGTTLPVQHMALNLGAPGDRRDSTGKLWLSYPRPSSRPGIDLAMDIHPSFAKEGGFFSMNADSYKVANTDTPWVYSSGARGLSQCKIPLIAKGQPAATYTVRLYFMAMADDAAKQRVFDISLQGKAMTSAFDLVAEAGGGARAHRIEFRDIPVSDDLLLELNPATGSDKAARLPLLSGIEVLRNGSAEIVEQVSRR